MKNILISERLISGLFMLLVLASCVTRPSHHEVKKDFPVIFPKYHELSIPYNIAPLNFRFEDGQEYIVEIRNQQGAGFLVSGTSLVDIPLKKWKDLLYNSRGGKLSVSCFVNESNKWVKYNDLSWVVIDSPIDPYLVYRLIEPSYLNWNEMSINERDITTFKEREVINNKATSGSCFSCHTFNQKDGSSMVFHMRKTHPGTFVTLKDSVKKLDASTDGQISPFVYPYWHPSGDKIAFSVNSTQMSIFDDSEKIIEVYDLASDLVIYDLVSNSVQRDTIISDPDMLESFPVFHPKGDRLFFCSAEKVVDLPADYKKLKYDLLAVDYCPETSILGNHIDTIISVSKHGKSISLPQIAPNGRFISCSIGVCGAFMSWDKSSNIQIFDLANNRFCENETLNSEFSESCTTWSSNSTWLVLSSRRNDNGYNAPFIVYVDQDGNTTTPFILPQKDPNVYKYRLKAFNLPQLLSSPCNLDVCEVMAKSSDKNTISSATSVGVN